MKITAVWLHEVADSIIGLERGKDLFIDPKEWGKGQSAIVRGINRLLEGITEGKYYKRMEYKVSAIEGQVRVRRIKEEVKPSEHYEYYLKNRSLK